MILKQGSVSSTQVNYVSRLQLLPKLAVKVAEYFSGMISYKTLSKYLSVFEFFRCIFAEYNDFEFDTFLLWSQFSNRILNPT